MKKMLYSLMFAMLACSGGIGRAQAPVPCGCPICGNQCCSVKTVFPGEKLPIDPQTDYSYSEAVQLHAQNVHRLELAWAQTYRDLGVIQDVLVGAPQVSAGGQLALAGASGRIWMLEPQSGRIEWTHKRPPPDDSSKFPSASGVAMEGGRFFEATREGTLVSIDGASGRVVWEISLPVGTGGSYFYTHAPIVAGQQLSVAFASVAGGVTSEQYLAFDVGTGLRSAMEETRPVPRQCPKNPVVVTAGNIAFGLADVDGHLVAKRLSDGGVVWRTNHLMADLAGLSVYEWHGRQYIAVSVSNRMSPSDSGVFVYSLSND